MIAIQTQTGKKIHVLEPKCVNKTYPFPFHPLCMGGKGREIYKHSSVKTLGTHTAITCQRCAKIIALDPTRFSSQTSSVSPLSEPSMKTDVFDGYSSINKREKRSSLFPLFLGIIIITLSLWGLWGS